MKHVLVCIDTKVTFSNYKRLVMAEWGYKFTTKLTEKVKLLVVNPSYLNRGVDTPSMALAKEWNILIKDYYTFLKTYKEGMTQKEYRVTTYDLSKRKLHGKEPKAKSMEFE